MAVLGGALLSLAAVAAAIPQTLCLPATGAGLMCYEEHPFVRVGVALALFGIPVLIGGVAYAWWGHKLVREASVRGAGESF